MSFHKHRTTPGDSSCHNGSLTLVVVDMASVLSELSELPPTLLTLPLQVLLYSAFLPVRGFLHVPPEQSLLKELLPTHITPVETNKTGLICRFQHQTEMSWVTC